MCIYKNNTISIANVKFKKGDSEWSFKGSLYFYNIQKGDTQFFLITQLMSFQ